MSTPSFYQERPHDPINDLMLRQCPRYDDPETRLKATLGQDAPRLLAQGRLILFACPICHDPWLQYGRSHAYPLSWEEARQAAFWLHVDSDPATGESVLPASLCPLCSAEHLGGMMTVETYAPLPQFRNASQYEGGYRLVWKGNDGSSLLCIVSRQYRSLSCLLETEPDIDSASKAGAQAMLSWLSALRIYPALIFPLTGGERCRLRERLSPGMESPSTSMGTSWKFPRDWHGWASLQTCLPLGGTRTFLVLAMADYPWRSPSCEQLLIAWQDVATRLLTHEVWHA